jgi:CBS domain containing-hemolysin-like protein
MLLFWIATGGLLLTALAAIGAESLREFSRHELGEICRRRNARRRLSEILRNYEQVALNVEGQQAVATVVYVVAAAFWTHGAYIAGPSAIQWIPLVLTATTGVLLLLAATVWIPHVVARLWAEVFLFHTWRTWRTVSAMSVPLALCARVVGMLLHRLAGRKPVEPTEESFDEEIRAIVSEGHREGLLETDEREMIEGVIELDDADVAEIMTPRSRMKSIHVDVPWGEMIDFVMSVPHTRIPVYDKNQDDVIGVLHTKDLLPILAKGDNQAQPSLRALLRKPIVVPETNRIDDLLEEFQQTRVHLAIVVDEYQRVSGLVTIEDILEEIVGEIVDEHDFDEDIEIKKLSETTCEALGRAHLDEINDAVGTEFPEDAEFDSIAGLIVDRLGRIPRVGETVSYDDLEITVLEATRRRVERVKIERQPSAQRDSA